MTINNATLEWTTLNQEIETCQLCPRLVAWREEVARTKRKAYQNETYWGKPVLGFGDPLARLFIVGLAPGAHGSNRTGRMFTGDSSGDTLFPALYRAGFANQLQAIDQQDGMVLHDAFITAVGRCAPPKNKPTAGEIAECRPFLNREFQLMPQIRVLLALGQIAFNGCIRLLRDHGYEVPRLKFGHAVQYQLTHPAGDTKYLLASYHPSRQNTQTGRLTQEMFDAVCVTARDLIG